MSHHFQLAFSKALYFWGVDFTRSGMEADILLMATRNPGFKSPVEVEVGSLSTIIWKGFIYVQKVVVWDFRAINSMGTFFVP